MALCKHLWLGTEDRGLYHLQRQSVRTLTQEQGLASSNVYPILEDHEGAIWVGSWPAGLTRIQEGKLSRYTEQDGLPGKVTALAEDNQNRLWVGTHGGLAVFMNGKLQRTNEPALPKDDVV